MYSVLAGAINHPDAINPYQGLFNYRSLKSIVEAGTSIDIVSPRPYAPPVGPYSAYSMLPKIEDWGPYMVHHPRFWYFLPKRIFYGLSGRSYAKRVSPYVDSVFDLPDIVHACHIYPDGYGLLPYVRKHDLPLFVVSHGKLLNSFGKHPPGVDKKIRETLEAAMGVLCVSDALASKAETLTDQSKVKTVPIGSDPENFPVDRQEQLYRELAIEPNSVIVLFVGEFSERKGISEIVEVLPDIDPENTEFVFIGHGGEMESELKHAVSKSEYSLRHIYTGITSLALRRWFAIADILLLPSYAEGRPTVVYEAMASKTAVLATKVGGIPEQVVDGETGVLIPPRDADALKVGLKSLATDRDRLQDMGEAGLERLRDQNWTWTNHATRVQNLHLEAIEGRSTPSKGEIIK